MSEGHVGRRIARAIITIFIFQLFWKFGGFIVSTLVWRRFGTRQLSDVYDAYMFAESTVIFALFVLFDKFVFPTFLPLFSEERELRGEEEAWKFANSFANLLILGLLTVVIVLNYSMSGVVQFIAPRWIVKHPATANLAIQFCRCMLPGLFVITLASVTHAVLNSYKRFAHAAAGAGMHRFIQALIFVVAFWLFGAPVFWAALAFVLAAPAKLITHGFGLREKLSHYRMAIPHWRPILKVTWQWTGQFIAFTGLFVLLAPGSWIRTLMPAGAEIAGMTFLLALIFFSVRGMICWLSLRRLAEKTLLQKFGLLAYPVLMGVFVARARDLVQDSYATHLEESGLFGALKYARKVGDAPMAIIPLAFGMAMFPFLCDMFTKQNLKALSEVVSRAIKMIVLFFLPLTVVVVILRVPVIELLASKNARVDLVDATALALALYALSFIFYASEMVLMQAFFSLQNTWLPTLIGAVASFGQIGLLYVAFDVLEGPESPARAWLTGSGITPFVVVALAYPLSRAFKNLILGSALHVRLKLFHLRELLSFCPQTAVLTAVTGFVTWTAWQGVAAVGTSLVGKCVRLGVPSLAALAAFLGTLFAFRKIGWPVTEFDVILQWLRETGWQKIRARFKGGGKRK